MADQPITGLPTKTSSGVASTDKMLGIDSAEGYQILVRDVAKYIIENCNVSTLAGAVQTPKAAIDALNSNKLPGVLSTEGSNKDLNNYTTNGAYAFSGNVSNKPSGASNYCSLIVWKETTTSAILQILYNQAANYSAQRRFYNGAWTDWEITPMRSEIDALNSNITIDASNKHTLIPSGSDFNSYTTPGVYYVMSDADGATMVNAPRNSSGKLIVMARHTSGYLAQYYYPSSNTFIRYIRSYVNNSWSMWIQQDINYENVSNRQYAVGSISSASTRTFEECGLTKFQYGSYFVVLRIDSASDGTWAGIVRHNSSGYQISEFYKGEHAASPYVTTDGIIKNDSSAAVSCYGLVFPINVWGNLLS